MKTIYQYENNFVLYENSIEWKPCINRESKSLELTIKLYSCHNINMKFLVVVTPPYIYHGCSTRKTVWEENFTGKQDLFESVNMKNCGRRKVRKHKEIKGSDQCVTLNIYEILNISEKFDNLNNMETTSSVKSIIGEIRKGVGNRSGSQDQSKVEKIQKGKVCHRKYQHEGSFQENQRVWKKIKVTYVKRIPKHEPTSSYFRLVVCIGDYMMRCGENNNHVHDGCEE